MEHIIRLWRTARSAAMRENTSRRLADRRRRPRSRSRRWLAMEPLEGRQMLSTFTVTSNADSTAAGTLRWAITESNATASTASAPNQIAFNLPVSEQTNGEYTIALNSALPALVHPVVINGGSQPSSGGQPVVQVDGKLAGSQASGFQVDSGASGSAIKGLTITDFTSSVAFSTGGVLVDGASNVTISNDDLGVLKIGTGILAEGNSIGVLLENGASHDIVSGDVIAGNRNDGVVLFGTGTEYNAIVGDEIGLPGGAVPNNVGVDVDAPNNTIGGTSAADADVITGNSNVGIEIDGYGTSGNLVEGTSVTANGYAGIEIELGASGNTVGGTAAGARDVISGNGTYGVLVFFDANANVVEGDFIGIDATGTLAQGNVDGVEIDRGSSHNTIGGTTAAAANIISGNSLDGVQISDSGTTGNVVEGDAIGTDLNALAAIPNARAGVTIQNGASDNTVGSTTPDSTNIISGNTEFGVWIIDGGTTGNVVEGDLIGTGLNPGTSVPNGTGVEIAAGASGNSIGGPAGAPVNFILDNTNTGVEITDPGTSHNVVADSGIGFSNFAGVAIRNGAADNTVGSPAPGSSTVISGNEVYGVDIQDAGTDGNTVINADIGTNFGGQSAFGNGTAGVIIQRGAAGNVLRQDVISGNSVYGVFITGQGSAGNVVEGDFIGTNSNGTSSVGNDDGVDIGGGASDNTIGGTTAAAANVISGNSLDGVQISDSGTTGNLVEGNFIGTNSNGTVAIPNARAGVTIQAGATGNIVGGTSVTDRNVISGNTQYGVWIIDGGTTGNVVEGDFLGTNAGGTGALANGNGVVIAYGASDNTIGGSSAAAEDLISGNTNEGVVITSPGTMGNVVASDDIGTQAVGFYAVPNVTGVLIEGGASNNLLENNVIGGNSWDGVAITGSGTNANELLDNGIGVNSADGIGVPNWNGVQLVGGSADSYLYQNVVAGNHSDGIYLEQTQGNDVSSNWVGINSNGVAFGNGEYGIILVDGASNNLIVSDNVQNNDAGGIATFGTGSGNQYYGNYSANNGGGNNYIWD